MHCTQTTRCLALTVAYDGTGYHGFQVQCAEHGPTIQGSLEKVWFQLFEESIRFTPAGRTDAGVHAAGQVVSFRTGARIPTDKVGKAMNSLLPRDIRVLEVWETRADFNARFSACWKRYDYWVDNRRVPDVFMRRNAYHEPVPLNLAAMRWEAKALIGRHNFRAFAASHGASRHYERTLSHCMVFEEENRFFEERTERRFSEECGLLRMSFVGDGFLYHMVRIIAGTLVGCSREEPLGEFRVRQTGKEAETMAAVLASRDRTHAGETLPPHGLILRHVEYQARRPSDVFADLPDSEWEESLVAPRGSYISDIDSGNDACLFEG
ncbi:MAG: tRNA pseudouridine(38-40) synthase TruA [Peptococcaceae bacterium]|nr:tRNA pseudouridine(38-40) synthase TruA [Peptococcaceae bacterium]